MKKARVIALYLPQFHPTAINDKYWGKGFTEWRNVAKAKPLYRGHYQPRIPSDLGFYDLRLQETQIAQAEMAKKYGIEGFCYWHYWFGNNKMILEKPLENVVRTKKPDYPFCVGWANHSWSNRTWEKVGGIKKNIVFLKQEYLGVEDYKSHFNYLLPMFLDERYIKVDGKPLFMVFNPLEIPDNELLIETWNELAIQNGLSGIHFVARVDTAPGGATKEIVLKGDYQKDIFSKVLNWGYDAIYAVPIQRIRVMSTSNAFLRFERFLNKLHSKQFVDRYDYKDVIKYLFDDYDYNENIYPMIIPHWDNTPRAGRKGYVFTNESPKLFGESIKNALNYIENKQYDKKIIFAHSWNEWGEGAYLEPDLKYGKQYLEQIKRCILDED